MFQINIHSDLTKLYKKVKMKNPMLTKINVHITSNDIWEHTIQE